MTNSGKLHTIGNDIQWEMADDGELHTIGEFQINDKRQWRIIHNGNDRQCRMKNNWKL